MAENLSGLAYFYGQTCFGSGVVSYGVVIPSINRTGLSNIEAKDMVGLKVQPCPSFRRVSSKGNIVALQR